MYNFVTSCQFVWFWIGLGSGVVSGVVVAIAILIHKSLKSRTVG